MKETTSAFTPEWADPQITGRNRVLMHAPLGAYPDAESALHADRGASPFMRCLNGTWKFALTRSPHDMPRGFAQPEFNDGAWHDMTVPSNWQLDPAVDDQPIYTNIPYPFEGLPPAPPEVNPTGWYRTSFEVPEGWQDRELFLLFESCDSACKVWINGVEAGYSQDSKLPHEFNITALTHPGRNHLAVMVPRYSAGFWLECQDYWHLSGIQRDVVLYSKPRAHIRDFIVRTDVLADRRARLSARVFMNDAADLALGYSVRMQLHEADGTPALATPVEGRVALSSPMYGDTDPEYGAAHLRAELSAPRLWTAETPYLYTLVFSLLDPAGRAVDFESCRVGVRQIEIRNRQLLINGRRLIVRGVNCHEHHPAKGRALSVADMRAELVAMKRLNFNAVRTSHYPRHSAYYDLCDELGVYVVDEANLETHGLQALISKDPAWLHACMERAQRMALRDKNHACVIAWSLGNESYFGPHHAAMAAWLRAYDPTRPVQYESGCPGPAITDILCPMYPKLDWVTEVLANASEQRPLIMCEYAYAKGNAGGNVHKYWDLVDRCPSFQGGFVWDWADKALLRAVNGRAQWAYGNEFDDGIGPDGYNYGAKENPQMCLNGVVLPDLTPKPGALELKKVQAPVTFQSLGEELLREGSVQVWNKYVACELTHLDIVWELTENGRLLQQGTVTAAATPPGTRSTLAVPLRVPETPAAGAEYWLNLTARHREATPWCEPGHVVGWDQFRMPFLTAPRPATPIAVGDNVAGSPAPAPNGLPKGALSMGNVIFAQAQRPPGASLAEAGPTPRAGRLTLETSPERFLVRGGDFAVVFDRKAGVVTEYAWHGRNILAGPLVHSFMRARTDNDYILGNPAGYLAGWRAAGLDRLVATTVSCSVTPHNGGAILIQCATRHAAVGGAAAILCQTVYTVTADGGVLVENGIEASAPVATLPRIGMRMAVAAGFDGLSWYGRGPQENYADRKTGALVGLYSSSVDDQFFPFIDPCECGGHEDTRWFQLQNAVGAALRVTGEPLVHFSALHYTAEELARAGHVYELARADDIHVHIDGFHMGVGGDTGWTPNVHPEYLLPPGAYTYAFRLSFRA